MRTTLLGGFDRHRWIWFQLKQVPLVSINTGTVGFDRKKCLWFRLKQVPLGTRPGRAHGSHAASAAEIRGRLRCPGASSAAPGLLLVLL